MPLALLLKEHLGVLTAGVKRTAPLGSIMDRATLVLRRQQGAFLHAWYGPGLAVDGLDLRVAVANAGEIQARVGHARSLTARHAEAIRGPGGGDAANIFMPAAGLAGVLAGAIVGGLVGAVLGGMLVLGILRLQVPLFKRLASIFTGGMRLWTGYKGLFGVGAEEGTDYLARVTGGREAAPWIDALTTLGRSALGDRPQRPTTPQDAVFVLLDRISALVAQAVGALATFGRLVPVARALRGIVDPVLGLVGVGERILTAAVVDTYSALAGVVKAGHIAQLHKLLVASLGKAARTIVGFVGRALAALRHPFTVLRIGIDAGWKANGAPVLNLIKEHPLVTFLKGLGKVGGYLKRLGKEIESLFPSLLRDLTPASVAAVAAAAKTVAGWLSSGSGGPGVASKAWAWARGKLGKLFSGGGGPPARLAPRRPVPLTPVLAPVVAAAAEREMAELPLNIVGSVPRVFPAERARLEAEVARRESDATYQAATRVVEAAARLAGPEIEAQLRDFTGTLDRLERTLVGRRRRPEPPVRDLPPPRRLVPVFRRVRVTGVAGDEHSGRAWVREVVRQLGAEPFPVPSVAAPGAG
jgi:hypothetical protein